MSVTPQELPLMDQENASIADLLIRAAKRCPKSGLYLVRGKDKCDATFVSYPALLADAKAILEGLYNCKCTPGTTVVLLLEHPGDFIPAFWACVLGGLVPCPLAPIRNDRERWVGHLAHITDLLGGPLFVSSGDLLLDLPASIPAKALEPMRRNTPHDRLYQARNSEVAALILTSGSTGKSKAVELTHGNLLSSLAGRAERQRLGANDVAFNWIAFDHVAALLESHMIALYVGATQVHSEPATILSDPLEFLAIIDTYRVSLAFAPNFFLGYVNAALETEQAAGANGRSRRFDLSCLRRVVTGGEANVVATGRRFLELLAPHGLAHGALWPAFGMTETCAACVYSDEFPECDGDREFASVGAPISGLEMRIMDERGFPARAIELGELQLRGPMIFHRYHHNEEATRAAFTEDGWFRTGDVGRIESTRLCLFARSKDSIIVNGVNYFSQELEAKLEQLPGIGRSFVAAFPIRPKGVDTERLIVAFATTCDLQDHEALYQLLVAVRNTTIMLWGFRPSLILPLSEADFPKTSLGKIQRSLMRRRVEAGDLHAAAAHAEEATRQQVGAYTAPDGLLEKEVTDIFSTILGIEARAVSTSVSFFDLGGTSLDILKLARLLQRKFELNATLALVLQNPTARSLARCVATGMTDKVMPYDPVIPLQLSGHKTPLFCVHPGNGEVFVLVNLAKYFLNDRPFYALRPAGFNDGEECFKAVDEMVRAYVQAIKRCQPRGPYAIAGYSLGCPIAFEIAKALEGLGNTVAFLGCIDYWPCVEILKLDFNMATGLALVLDLITKEQFSELNKQLRPEIPDDETCAYVLTFSAQARVAELNLDLRKFAMWARVAHSIETLLFSHMTAGKVRRMTIFRGEGISPRYTAAEWATQTPAWRNQISRWSEFVCEPRYVDVSGDHHSLIGPRHVATFQAALRAEIDLAWETM